MNDIFSLAEYIQNFIIMKELKHYRPYHRPITGKIIEKQEHKRKLICRDWFFFAVWSIRIKKALAEARKARIAHDLRMDEFIALFYRISKKCEIEKIRGDSSEATKKDNKELREILTEMKKKYDEEIHSEGEENKEALEVLKKCQVTIRAQEISIKIEAEENGKPIIETIIMVFL